MASIVSFLLLLGWCFLQRSEASFARESVVRSPEGVDQPREQQQQQQQQQHRQLSNRENSSSSSSSNGEDLSFPGIYTAHFAKPTHSEHAGETPTTGNRLREFDVVRIDCDDDDDDDDDAAIGDILGIADETAPAKNRGKKLCSCRGHVLIQNGDTHRDILASTVFPEMRSLRYNSTLTERWVRPKMRVIEEHARRRELMPLSRSSAYSTIPGYSCYYDYQGTLDWIDDFVAEWASSSVLEVTWTDIGDSWEKTTPSTPSGGYDIHALTITKKPPSGGGTPPPDKAPFLIVSGVHAREYTPPILVRKWLERLVDNVEAGDADFLSMLEQTEIHWIPYLNPDGRVLAETTQIWRRKNTNDRWTSSSQCGADSTGVDLNRNFPFEWGDPLGSSGNACRQDSRGPGPASEPESRALVSYAIGLFDASQLRSSALEDPAAGDDYNVEHGSQSVNGSSRRWKGYDPWTTRGVYIDIHSYGQVYIYPWGNQNAVCPNDAGFRSGMGHIYTLTDNPPKGPGFDFFGVASGATDDWAYGVLGAFSMTWELGSEFHEPCQDFEDASPKHYGAFEYLAKIAPFPFALARGPIVPSLADLPQRVALEYYQTTAAAEDCARFLRMSTDGVDASNLEFGVRVQLPDILQADFGPIDFFDDDPNHPQYRPEPSKIDAIRVYHGGGNPLVGIAQADQTAANRGGDYWEVDVSDRNFDPNADSGTEYRISIPVAEVWEALGIGVDCGANPGEERTLYFQAIDDVGNPGPVTARSLSVALAETYDCTSGDGREGLVFQLEVRLDAGSGSEFGWTLTNDLDGSGWEGTQNFAFPDNQSFQSTVCLPKNECWTLGITDTDGLADNGYYKAHLAAEEVVSGGAFAGTATHEFCVGQQKDCADVSGAFRYRKRKRSKKTTKSNCRKIRNDSERNQVKICNKKSGRKHVHNLCAKTCGRAGEGDCMFLEEYGAVPVPTVSPGSLVQVDMDDA